MLQYFTLFTCHAGGTDAEDKIYILLLLSLLQATMDNIVSYSVLGIWSSILKPLTQDTTGELDVLQHDCNLLSMDCAEVGVLKKAHQIIFAGLLGDPLLRLVKLQVRL